MTIIFRTEHTAAELHAFVDLEMAIWCADARDAVPVHLLHALTNNGGVLVGAYTGTRLVGLALGFPARRGKRWLLWSHASGVHPDFQRQGIGLALKQHQRQWALAHGFDQMRWTFDPLQAGNASFNLALLGAQADTYHVDYYGEMTDGINAGLPSDRVEAVWNLKNTAARPPSPPAPSINQQAAILSVDSAGLPLAAPPANAGLRQHYVEIPALVSALGQRAALSWRLALRAVLQPALSSGSSLTGFQRIAGRCWYVLTTPAPWFLYVLECADGSLYTGITTDLERRLAQHNAGRGAAYTAARRPVRRLGSWRFANHPDALRAEAAFKQQSRAAKLQRLRQQSAFQGGVFVESA